jgi:hypothetical protein
MHEYRILPAEPLRRIHDLFLSSKVPPITKWEYVCRRFINFYRIKTHLLSRLFRPCASGRGRGVTGSSAWAALRRGVNDGMEWVAAGAEGVGAEAVPDGGSEGAGTEPWSPRRRGLSGLEGLLSAPGLSSEVGRRLVVVMGLQTSFTMEVPFMRLQRD